MAQRARKTLAIASDSGGWTSRIEFHQELYDTNVIAAARVEGNNSDCDFLRLSISSMGISPIRIVGLRRSADGIWLVSFMHYDLGFLTWKKTEWNR